MFYLYRLHVNTGLITVFEKAYVTLDDLRVDVGLMPLVEDIYLSVEASEPPLGLRAELSRQQRLVIKAHKLSEHFSTKEELDDMIWFYEKKHGMDSDEMLSRMKTGELDGYEYMKWASLLDLR